MNLMAVFAHPDDELGCIGTLAKHAARGDRVMLVWTTHGELASQFGDAGHEEVRRVRQEHGAWVAGQIGAGDAVLGQHQVEHRGDQPAVDPGHRDPTAQHATFAARVGEVRQQHLGGLRRDLGVAHR